MARRTADTRDTPSRYRHAVGIARLMPAIVSPLLRKRGFLHREIVSRWREIAGAEAALYSRPLAIRFPRGRRDGGVLKLGVASAFAPLLQHDSPRILERINGYFGYAAVERIELQQGAFVPQEREMRRATEMAPTPEAVRQSERLTSGIRDDKLRALLARWGAVIADGEVKTGN